MKLNLETLGKLPLFGALALSACTGGGGDSSTTSATTTLDFLVTDAPADDLLSFAVTIEELRLVRTDGTASENALAGPVAVELLGLTEVSRWIGRVDTAAGDFRAVRLELDPNSVTARAMDGTPVAVDVQSSTWEIDFAAPTRLADYGRLEIDLDVARSLDGDLGAPPVAFDPAGAVLVSGASASTVIDELEGRVVSVDAAAGTLVLDGFVDGLGGLALGEVTVTTGAATVLVDDAGALATDAAAFLGALQPGATVVEVHGALTGRAVDAARIEVEDLAGGGPNPVKIEGLVVDVGQGEIELLIVEVEKGQAIAGPVLSTLGDPQTIRIAHGPTTRFSFDGVTAATAADVGLAQRVKVRFSDFVNPPFPAASVSIENRPQLEGRISDVGDLPFSFQMLVNDGQPPIFGGGISASSTPVTVKLDDPALELFLDTEGNPSIPATQLLVGLRVEVEGAVAGDPLNPILEATKTKVRAGRFEGHVASVSPATRSFNATMTRLRDSFGNTVTLGNVTVVFDGATIVEKDAASEAAFYALFQNLKPGESIEIDAAGVGTGLANEVRVFELEAEVE